MSIHKDDLIQKMQKIGSSVFADVMENKNVMDYKLKPVNDAGPLVGLARTVSVPPGDNLFLHYAMYEVSVGDIIVVDGKDFKGSAYLGELMAGAAQKLGIKGIIIDGLVRDRSELRQLDLSIYAKGFTPIGPKKEGPGTFDQTITCAGAVVSPGDFIVGDEDGVVVVPYKDATNLIAKAENKIAYESSRLEKIEAFQLNDKHVTKDAIKPGWLDDAMKPFKGNTSH
ncbi:RraA family protein [Shouchella sp. 1P09AA]|uniref:RraA family protein n=1 Tax=unclassified Shouchella TaxID=2893065 RepID=UPI0039A0F21C